MAFPNFDITKPPTTFESEIDIPDKWSPEWIEQEMDKEPELWLMDKEPMLKEFLDWVNPIDLVNLIKQTYETTPEMQEATNLAVLGQMGLSFLDAAGGGSSKRFMQWEQEARSRNISPMMYVEPVAATAVIALMGMWGVAYAAKLLSSHPKLLNMAKVLFGAKVPKPLGLPSGYVDVPFEVFSGYPITRELSKAVQLSSRLSNVGDLATRLNTVLPSLPGIAKTLVAKAVEGTVTNQDIIKLVDKEQVFDVSTVFGLQTDIIQNIDEKTGKVLSIKVEAPIEPKKLLQEWELDKEIFLSYTVPKGDKAYLMWSNLKLENELERAKIYRAKLQKVVDEGTADSEDIDVARYALERIRKKMHSPPPHSMFYDTTKGKEEGAPKVDIAGKEKVTKPTTLAARKEGIPSNKITVTLPSGQKTSMEGAKPVDPKAETPDIEPIELNAQSYVPITPEVDPVNDYISSVEFSKMLMEDTGVPAIKYDHQLELPIPAPSATVEGAAGAEPPKFTGILKSWGTEEHPIPLAGKTQPSVSPTTPRYTAHVKERFTPEVTLARPISDKEMMKLLNNGLAENRVGLRFFTSWMRNDMQGYQERTGFPLYTEGHIPLMEAGFRDSTFRGSNKTIIHKWRKELSPEELITLDWNMNIEQAIYEIETYIASHPDLNEKFRDELLNTALAYDVALSKLDPLNTTQIEIKQAYRVMMDNAFDYAGGDPETYLQNYVTLMGETQPQDKIVDREFWGLYTKNYEPWFMKDRKSVGKISAQYNIFDKAEMYIDAAAYKHYLDDLKPVEEVFNRLPGNVTVKNSPRSRYLMWLNYLKTGTPESWLGNVPKSVRRKLDSAFITVFGKALPKDFNISRLLVQLAYFGTMSYNPSPPMKNLTQFSGNIGEMPVQDLVAGLKFIMTKEGWHTFQESGVLAGFSPYLQRQFGLNPTASTARKAVYYGLEVPSRTGMLGFSGADTVNRFIWPAEYVRVLNWGEKYIKGDIDWATYVKKTDLDGMHPCVSEQIKPWLDSDKQDWVNYQEGIEKVKPEMPYLNKAAHALAYERTATHQNLYQKENRIWMGRQGGIGEILFQYMSWPIGKVEQQADILGAAQRLFKEGKPGPAFYQLWKEAKILMYWTVLASVATGMGIEGWQLARRWGFGWLPTTAGPVATAAEEIAKSAVGIITGYKWKSQPLGDSFRDLMGLFDPTVAYRSRYARIEPYDTAYQKTLTMLGQYIDRNEYGKDLYKEWINAPITYEEWIKQQDFSNKGE